MWHRMTCLHAQTTCNTCLDFLLNVGNQGLTDGYLFHRYNGRAFPITTSSSAGRAAGTNRRCMPGDPRLEFHLLEHAPVHSNYRGSCTGCKPCRPAPGLSCKWGPILGDARTLSSQQRVHLRALQHINDHGWCPSRALRSVTHPARCARQCLKPLSPGQFDRQNPAILHTLQER